MSELTGKDIKQFLILLKKIYSPKAIVMIPSVKGYDIYEIDPTVAKMAIKMNSSPLIKDMYK